MSAPLTESVFNQQRHVRVLTYLPFGIPDHGNSLSFYKEELAGETNNYVHLRAAAEETSANHVLRQLVDEVLDTAHTMNVLTSEDAELAALWQKYFHVRVTLIAR